jgi:hypothetical protein
MTTPYEVPGFTRPAELYELASNHGVHVGSIDRLVRFAIEIQRRGNAEAVLKRMTINAEELALYDGMEAAK